MFGDLHNVKGRIKTIDKDLDMFYVGNGQYEITHKGGHFMSISKEELDDRTIRKVREVVYKNVNADILAEIEANNKKIESSKQRDCDNTIESIAKELRPYVKRLD
jgi:hypothetical protein